MVRLGETNQSTECGIKNKPWEKSYLKNTRRFFLYFLPFNVEIVTYDIREFRRNIQPRNKTTAAWIRNFQNLWLYLWYYISKSNDANFGNLTCIISQILSFSEKVVFMLHLVLHLDLNHAFPVTVAYAWNGPRQRVTSAPWLHVFHMQSPQLLPLLSVTPFCLFYFSLEFGVHWCSLSAY